MTPSTSNSGAVRAEPARATHANGSPSTPGSTRGTVAVPADAFAELLLAAAAGVDGASAGEAAGPADAALESATGDGCEAGASGGSRPDAIPVPTLASSWTAAWAAVSDVVHGTAAGATSGVDALTRTATAVHDSGRAEPARVGMVATGGRARAADPAETTAPAGLAPAGPLAAGAAGGATRLTADAPALVAPTSRGEGDPARGGAATASLLASVSPAAAHAPDAPRAPVLVHESTLPSHPSDAAFAGDLVAEVRLMAGEGLQEARLHLNPIELGPVHVRLVLEGGTADLLLSAEHAATREGLQQALPELRERLAAEGFSVGEAAVTSGQGGAGGFDQAGEQATGRQTQPPRTDGRGELPASAVAPAGHGGAARHVGGRAGLLDLYA